MLWARPTPLSWSFSLSNPRLMGNKRAFPARLTVTSYPCSRWQRRRAWEVPQLCSQADLGTNLNLPVTCYRTLSGRVSPLSHLVASKPDSTVRLSAKDLTFLLLLVLPAISLAGTQALYFCTHIPGKESSILQQRATGRWGARV